jgi:cytidylate kinase
MKNINIAIDGPAGAGKSSIAKKVSSELEFIYVDTGALYRSIALFKLENNLDSDELISKLSDLKIEIKFIDKAQHVFLNNVDVSDKIRTPEVSMNASTVSAMPEVREFLFELQRKIARENNIIMDGRDIGTVVLPDADLKIFLTASVEERAKRRWLELSEKAEKENCPSLDEIKTDIIKRDHQDMTREIAPLKQADDAILVDTSNMNFDESVEYIRNMIEKIIR